MRTIAAIFSTLIVLTGCQASQQVDDGLPRNGAINPVQPTLTVWHSQTQQWTTPETFFELELARLNGPTYGTRRGNNYPDYDSVEEWQTLVDLLPDGRVCPMVFFHNRWRRLPDVLALDERLRNYGGCKDVFKF